MFLDKLNLCLIEQSLELRVVVELKIWILESLNDRRYSKSCDVKIPGVRSCLRCIIKPI